VKRLKELELENARLRKAFQKTRSRSYRLRDLEVSCKN
jgi:predicted nuclease with TOPRIM domain